MFAQIMMGLAEQTPDNKTTSIDAPYLKAHRTASSLGLKEGERGRLTGPTKGGTNTNLHPFSDNSGRPRPLLYHGGSPTSSGLDPSR